MHAPPFEPRRFHIDICIDLCALRRLASATTEGSIPRAIAGPLHDPSLPLTELRQHGRYFIACNERVA